MRVIQIRKFIVAIAVTLVMTFGVLIAHGFSFSAPVLVPEPPEDPQITTTMGQGPRVSTRSRTNFNPGEDERARILDRFPDLPLDFDSPVVYIGEWSLFDVNDYNNLEINVTHGSVRLVMNDGEASEPLSRTNFGQVAQGYRMFLIGQDFNFGFIHPSHVSTLYIFDDARVANGDSMLTISVPGSASYIFDTVNIYVKNGTVEIDEGLKGFLAENLNVSFGGNDKEQRP